ncbi:MAG TPA: hypothetical protein VGH27_12275 [Streptosporangiaceae bacterium]|jgi:hypothetical protein
MSVTDLDRLIEAASELTGMRAVLPVELFIKLDTFRADLMAEREDRAAPPGGTDRPARRGSTPRG